MDDNFATTVSFHDILSFNSFSVYKGFFLTLATFSLKEKYVLCGYKNVFEFLKALTEDIKKKKKSTHNFVLSMH